MIKYVVVPEKRTVYGIIEHTGNDALNKINKMVGHNSPFCVCDKKYKMPEKFKATVVCDPRDEWSVEDGKRRAKAKVLKNYYRSLDKKISAFRADVLELNGRVFETPDEFKNNT